MSLRPLSPDVEEALFYLESFINARNGRCLPSDTDLRDAERSLWAARGPYWMPPQYRRPAIKCPDGKVWTDEKGYDG